jgi:hypothetical protein
MPYLRGITVTYGDRVYPQGEPFIVGLAKNVEELQLTVGYTNSPNSNFFPNDVAKIFSVLRRSGKIPKVMSHVGIMNLIFEQRIYDRKGLIDLFIAIGLGTDIKTAVQAADVISRNLDRIFFAANAGGISFGGELTRELDYSDHNLDRLVTVPVTFNSPMVDQYLKALGMSIFMLQRDVFRRIHLNFDDTVIPNLKRLLTPRRHAINADLYNEVDSIITFYQQYDLGKGSYRTGSTQSTDTLKQQVHQQEQRHDND